MKRTLLLVASILTLTAAVHARIGETIAETVSRWGQGELVAQEDATVVRFRYRRPDMKVDVQYKNGHAVWELYHATSPMTKDRVHPILEHNGPGHRWAFDGDKVIWTRDDGSIRVSHFQGRPNEIFVEKL